MLIDTHVHLNSERYNEDRLKLINEFKENNLEKVISVSYDMKSSKDNFELSQKHKKVYCALGMHPHDAKEYCSELDNFIKDKSSNVKVVAIGEIGLDYYYDLSPREIQKQVFVKQLEIANELGLPVIIHIRDSFGDALEILKENKHLLNNSGVVHCFSGSLEFAKEMLKLGLYLGFDGPITFKNSNLAEKVVKYLPIDKILLETDCPYLTPAPHRGERNEPKYVALVAKKVAEVFEIDEEQLIAQTNKNAKALFKKLV